MKIEVRSTKFEVRSAKFDVLALCLALTTPLVLAAQQRDAPTGPTGSGAITGVVMSGDATPQPVRRAVVTMAGGGLRDARSELTDDAGRFVFDKLPAGSFTITARKAAHLQAAYGATRPGRQGSTIALAAGQRMAISLTMFKGGVISGVLRDPSGQPVGGVQVAAMDVRGEPGIPSLGAVPFTTDDRGAYRIYGLMPGEYFVAAMPAGDRGGAQARSSAEIDSILSSLTQRLKSPPSAAVQLRVPPAATVNLAPVYFPGTPLASDAIRIRLGAAEERAGVSFEVGHARVASIEGLVAGDVPNLASVALTISPTPEGPRLPGFFGIIGATGKPPNADGEFSYGNMPPGRYRIVARGRRGPADPNAGVVPTGRGGGAGTATVTTTVGPPFAYTGEQLFAVAEVEMRGEDVKGVTMTLQPGGSIAGRVVFDVSAPPADLSTIRISLSQNGSNYSSSSGGVTSGTMLTQLQPVTVRPDGTFRIQGIGPASYNLGVTLPPEVSKLWTLRSAMVDGRDLLDETIVGPSVEIAGVTLTLSDKRTELSGSLQSPAGQPATDYFVVVFSADRRYWRTGARRSKFARPATDGRFSFADLPAGEYLIAAVTDLEPAEWQEAGFLEQVAPAAVRVTLAEGEKKVQDLRIR